jgi:hypothetical protein
VCFLVATQKWITGISSNVMPSKFARKSINVQWKNMKVEESLWRPSLSKVQVFQWHKDFLKVED